jgi:hypothetical protein
MTGKKGKRGPESLKNRVLATSLLLREHPNLVAEFREEVDDQNGREAVQ